MTVSPPPQSRNLRVAIVGGGPAGLATAIALQSVPDVEVSIYEQARNLREVGAGISIGRNTWNVLELLGVANVLRKPGSGHVKGGVLNMNGKTGEELHRRNPEIREGDRYYPMRTQRITLQSALLSHVRPNTIQLSKKLAQMTDQGAEGVELRFKDGTVVTADLVVGADGIRSVVRDTAWPDYEIKFTGTTIWRALLPWDDVLKLDPRFGTTAWWHASTSHVYLSPVGEGLGEIAAREWQDPKTHAASKVSWGVPVDNVDVESHFTDYLPSIQKVLKMVPQNTWREFAAFAGPELATLTAWNNKIVLVGDSSHALSGAFGSGAGFAMEDGWVLAQALRYFNNNANQALGLFEAVRLPYYSRMYDFLEQQGVRKKEVLQGLGREATDEDRVAVKIIKDGGAQGSMAWIYGHDIGVTWQKAIAELEGR